jgi:hypothetical protein
MKKTTRYRGRAAALFVALRTPAASAVSDPRQEAPICRVVAAARVTGSERGFTGIIGARVQSSLGFSRSRQDRGAACEYR